MNVAISDVTRRRNRRLGLWIVLAMISLYAASIAGVLVLN